MKPGTFIKHNKNLWVVDENKYLIKLTGKNKGKILDQEDVEDQEKLVCIKVSIVEVK